MGLKSKIYLHEKVENSERLFGSAEYYYPVTIVDINGKESNGMLSDNDIERLQYRAARNPEDMPNTKNDLLDWIFGSHED